jgi:large subunit ribosomal protein L35
MAKAKSRKSITRRFKISGTGKVMRGVSFGRHLRRNKSKAQKRNYKVAVEVTGRIARRVKRLMALA